MYAQRGGAAAREYLGRDALLREIVGNVPIGVEDCPLQLAREHRRLRLGRADDDLHRPRALARAIIIELARRGIDDDMMRVGARQEARAIAIEAEPVHRLLRHTAALRAAPEGEQAAIMLAHPGHLLHIVAEIL